jgi:membrane protein
MSAMDIGKRVVKESLEDDVTGLAAEMSYRFLFAIFPMFIVVAAAGSMFAQASGVEDPTAELMGMGLDTLPSDARSLIEGQLNSILSSTQTGLLSFGLLTALWAGAGGIKAVIKGMNRAYDVQETRPFWRANLVAVGLTLLLAVAVIGGFLVLVVGQFFVERIATTFGDGGWQQTVISLARWPIAVVLLIVGMAFLYWAAPNAKLPFRWISPGAVVFVIGWLLATAAFGFYVSNFSNYNQTYGALGGVIVLMLWLYLTNIILLVGAELNAVLFQQNEPAEAIEAGIAPAGRSAPPESAADEARARDRAGSARASSNGGGNGSRSDGAGSRRGAPRAIPAVPRDPIAEFQAEPAGRKLVTGAVAATVAVRALRSDGRLRHPIIDEPPPAAND